MNRLVHLSAGFFVGVILLNFEPNHRIDLVEALIALLNIVGVIFLAFFSIAIGMEAIRQMSRKTRDDKETMVEDMEETEA